MNEDILDAGKLGLNHLGFIVDGNRRWAQELGLPTKAGHEHAIEVLKDMVYAAQARNLKYVSAFIFSTENWNRSKEEVGYLMDLFLAYFQKDLKQLVRDGFRIVFLGRRNGIRARIRAAIEKTEKDSAGNTGTTLALCFNYGGQAEIVDAAKKIIEEKIQQMCHSGLVPESTLSTEKILKRVQDDNFLTDITEESFAHFIYHPEIPPLDMLVRSSGEMRLSGYMLWRAAYAELMWIDKNWPDMSENDLDKIIAEFGRRQRRFGK